MGLLDRMRAFYTTEPGKSVRAAFPVPSESTSCFDDEVVEISTPYRVGDANDG